MIREIHFRALAKIYYTLHNQITLLPSDTKYSQHIRRNTFQGISKCILHNQINLLPGDTIDLGLACLIHTQEEVSISITVLNTFGIFGEIRFRALGKPTRKKSAVFFNIVQKAFDPLPLSFEHHVVNFLGKPQKSLFMQILCC